MNVTINVVLSPVVILLLVTSSCLILTSQAARPQPSAATAAKTRPQAIQPQTVKHTLKKQKVAEEKDIAPPPHVTAQEARRLDVMVPLAGGDFLMGVRDHTSRTGEHPLRHVSVRPFKIDKYPVTNANFERFLTMKRKYVTSAEMTGWSWVFFSRAPRDVIKNHTLSQPDDPWWFKVPSASWKKVHGKDEVRELAKQLHPVVHVSYHDASAFCYAIGKRLPTEHEWEFAARGGLQGQRYPWGENWQKNRSNVWQGLFPQENKKLDGYDGLAPVNAYRPQNNYGLYDMIGNVWEWTSSLYTVDHTADARRLRDSEALYVVKGGSFVDSRDGTSNLEARVAARKGLPPSYTAENVGFRCAQSLEGAKTIAKPPAQPKLPYVHEPVVADKGPRKPRVHTVEETWAYKVKKTIANFLLPSNQQPVLPGRPWSMRREEL